MRLSLKAKQVAGVTLIVGLAVAISSLFQLVRIAKLSIVESANEGVLVEHTIIQQAGRVTGSRDLRSALKLDPGLRSTLEAAIAYSPNVTYAAIVDRDGIAIAHSTPALEDQLVPSQPSLMELTGQGVLDQMRAIYSDRTFEIRERLLTQSGEEFGDIRVGTSMLLVHQNIRDALVSGLFTTAGAIAVALIVASGFAQWLLRPIAIVQTGLARLGRGEVNVKLDLPSDDVFGELGQSFATVSATLAAARSQLAGQPAALESIVDRLEDAVAVFGSAGELLFANPSMRAALGASENEPLVNRGVPPEHPDHSVLARALRTRQTAGPESVTMGQVDDEQVEHVVTGHALNDRDGHFVGVMLLARNVAYRSQLQSTLRYSQKLASLNRLLAGVAHEVKNPLNAMTIHLELLRQKLGNAENAARANSPASASAGGADLPGVLRHAGVIGQEIRRLDEVVQGFLKFSRPEELTLRAVALRPLIDEVFTLVGAEAAAQRITLRNECPPDLPPVQGDPTLLRQALLNLALNACQAMPGGGMLTLRGRRVRGGSVELEVADTGVGIAPEHLGRIFNLYFTTREGGSGLGLSMVYRTVQLHDGSIEAESVVGHGTTFRLRLPQAETGRA